MPEWTDTTLGDIADIRFSNVDKKAQPNEIAVSLCNYMDVYANEYVTPDLDFMPATATGIEIERFRVDPGDVIITKDSETPDDIGIPAVVRDTIPNLVCGYHLALLKIRHDDVDSVFLAKQLGSPEIANYFARRASGSTRYGLSAKTVAATPVRLAPPDQQRKVGQIFLALDEAIAQTEALIAKMQQVKAGMMHDLFSLGVTRDGHLRPTRAEDPQLYKKSMLGWISKDWNVVPVSELAAFITSGSRGWAEYYSEAGPIFIRIGNLTREHINLRWDDLVRVSPPRSAEGFRTAVQANDILISITADLGVIGVVNEGVGEAYVNQHIALVRPKVARFSRFVAHFLSSVAGQAQFSRANDSGAKAGLNLPTVGRVLCAWPTRDDERASIARSIDSIDETLVSHKTESMQLKHLKRGLMHDLLTGRVRVRASSQGSE